MYARHFTFKSSAQHRQAIENMADRIYEFTKTLSGFVSATYLVSDDETEYGSLTIWQSKEQAEEAGAAIREKIMPELEGMVTAPPEINVMMVYEPNS